MKVPTNSKGFTLIEVLIVAIITGILATIAIIAYGYVMDAARRTEAISALGVIRNEMELYNINKGSYPLSINFSNFTDQNGAAILVAGNWDRIKDKVYSWDSYTLGSDTYTLTVQALDSNHTFLILTPKGVTIIGKKP